ncbi:MAG: hypothetical protein BMS9Abin31_0778 [Gammaproteobacteria bacterium]|nr:MAG: hypothetical protein BMS9Abin31_0778 [Gammaproteobacteria bacterium]
MFKRISILFTVFAVSVSAQAMLIDFTDKSWEAAINAGTGTSATIGNVTLTANTGSLTFNRNDSGGCKNGQPTNGLQCDGDGIGINNDEITQGGSQQITVSFSEAVNINNILLLDLFANETGYELDWSKRTGEIAVIDGLFYSGPNPLAGGYYATGITGQGITSIVFSGYLDRFSDYALAGIDISPVPIPGAAILFGSALLGFFGFKRRRTV